MYTPNPSLLFLILTLCAGHETLAETCPLCEHHPLRKPDCAENIPLRKTIQVFLRHAQQKAQVPPPKQNKLTPVDVEWGFTGKARRRRTCWDKGQRWNTCFFFTGYVYWRIGCNSGKWCYKSPLESKYG